MRIIYAKELTEQEKIIIEQELKQKSIYHQLLMKLGYDGVNPPPAKPKDEGINAIVEHIRIKVPIIFDDHGNLDVSFVIFLVMTEIRKFYLDYDTENKIVSVFIKLHLAKYIPKRNPNHEKNSKLH